MSPNTSPSTILRNHFKKRLQGLLIALAFAFVFLYSPGGAMARALAPEGAGRARPATGGKAHEPKPRARRSASGENQIEEFDIVGKIYKPEVFVFLGRKSLNLSWDLDDPRFKRSFLDAVVNSVWGPPF